MMTQILKGVHMTTNMNNTRSISLKYTEFTPGTCLIKCAKEWVYQETQPILLFYGLINKAVVVSYNTFCIQRGNYNDEHRSYFEAVNTTSYIVFTDELWGVDYEYYFKYWPHRKEHACTVFSANHGHALMSVNYFSSYNFIHVYCIVFGKLLHCCLSYKLLHHSRQQFSVITQ